MSCRMVYQEILQYQRARLKFCQVIGECASRAQNIPYIENEGVIDLLMPLLTDPELAIRSNAVCCLSRMANHSDQVARQLIDRKVPETILRELINERNNNLHYRRAVLQALKAMAKHSPETATLIVECGGLSALLICLEEKDVLMKEAACCGIGSIVRQSSELAMSAVSQGAATLLVLCLQLNEVTIKQVACLALGDIARHSPRHAQAVCDAGAAGSLMCLLESLDVKLKRQTLCALSNIAAHSSEMAEAIASSDIFPKVLIHLGHENFLVQRQSARLIMEVTKHSLELAQVVVTNGGIGLLLQSLTKNESIEDDIITPVATALGYIAGHSPHFALAIIECKGVPILGYSISGNRSQNQLASCVWALGHIGQHSPEHCKYLSEENLFTKVLELYDNGQSSDDLCNKCKHMLQSCFQCCLDVAAMEPLLYAAPPEIVECILRQISKVLPNDASARRVFQTVGGLKMIQEIQCTPSSEVAELVAKINSCYSEEVVKFYVQSKESRMASNESGGSQFKSPKDFFATGDAQDNLSTDRSTVTLTIKVQNLE